MEDGDMDMEVAEVGELMGVAIGIALGAYWSRS